MNKELNKVFGEKDKYLHYMINHLPQLLQLDQVFISSFSALNNNSTSIHELPYLSLTEQFLICQNFYDALGIDININQLIANGTINFDIDSHFSKKNKYQYGVYHSSKRFSTIETYNGGTILDVAVLVHEIAHNYNISYPSTTIQSSLTECLSLTSELIFWDYLQNIGEPHAPSLLNNFFKKYLTRCRENYGLIKMLNLFYKMGDISEESYQMLYKDSGYSTLYKSFAQQIEDYVSTDELFLIFIPLEYIFGFTLSTYLFASYKKDPVFIQNIKAFNRTIKKSSSNPLLPINLHNLEPADIKAIADAYEYLATSSTFPPSTKKLNNVNQKRLTHS